MENKTDYRIYAKNLRKSLDIPRISAVLVQKLRESDLYKSAKHVMLFYPTKYEIDLRDLLKDDKNFYLPKVDGDNLLVCPYTDSLEISKLNIFEPCSEPVCAGILDLVVVPALMADRYGYRLGYGGGFYDRFLADLNVKTVTLLPEELLVENLPNDDFDVKIDFILHT